MADAIKRLPEAEDKKRKAKEQGGSVAVIGTAVLVKVIVEFVFFARECGLEVEAQTQELLKRLTDPESPRTEPYDSETLDAIDRALEGLEGAGEVGVFISKLGVGGIGVALLTALVLPAAAAASLAIGGAITTGVGLRMSATAHALLRQLREARKLPRVTEDPSDVVD